MPNSNLVLHDYLPYRLAVTSNVVSNLVYSGYSDLYGLKIPEWRLVAILHETGASTQQALLPKTGMDKVTVSRAAHTLTKRRLIQRTPHQTDGRSHILFLTEDGESLYAKIAPIVLAIENDMLAAFTPEETHMFKEYLRRIERAASLALDAQA